jgi:hypothetical protein
MLGSEACCHWSSGNGSDFSVIRRLIESLDAVAASGTFKEIRPIGFPVGARPYRDERKAWAPSLAVLDGFGSKLGITVL